MLIWLAATMDSLWGLFLDQCIRDTKEGSQLHESRAAAKTEWEKKWPHFPLNPDCLIGIRILM